MGAQPELGLERAEDGFDVGERGVGAPQGVLVPVGLAAAEAVDARMGGHRAVLGLTGPGDGGGLLAGFVGGDGDLVMGGDARVLGFEAPDALPDLWEALVGAGARQPVVELGEGGFEAGGETLDDAAFLLGALLGVAVQAHLVGVGGDDLVQMDGLPGARLDGHGGLGVELPVALAADDQIAVAALVQPRDGVVGGDAAVHDDEGAGGRLQGLEHAGQRAVLLDVAGKDLRAAHEAAGIEHQAQGQQRTVAALLLRVPALGLRVLAGLAFEVRVGQVVERHRRLQVEQLQGPSEQVRLDRLAMRHQRVRGAVELHRADGLEVDAEQLPETAALLQPPVGRALGGRLGHAPAEEADRGGTQGAVDAQAGQQVRQPHLLERPQADLLDADGARSDEAQRIDVDRLDIGGADRAGTASDQLRGDPLCLLVHGGRTIGHQGGLTGQGVGDAVAEQRPLRLGNVEVAPEVEQGALAHGAAEAFGVDEAMREVGLTVGGAAGLGAPNEHGATIAGGTHLAQVRCYDYGTTFRF